MPRPLATRKGKSKNRKQREATEVAAAAAVLAADAKKRKEAARRASGAASPRTHVPQAGKGGVRRKIDVDQLSPISKAKIMSQREWSSRCRRKKSALPPPSAAVLADPTEAWRTITDSSRQGASGRSSLPHFSSAGA